MQSQARLTAFPCVLLDDGVKMLNTNLTVENEPVKKKQLFADLETSELDVLLDSAQSQHTKYNTAFAVSVYKGKLVKKMFKKNVPKGHKYIFRFSFFPGQ